MNSCIADGLYSRQGQFDLSYFYLLLNYLTPNPRFYLLIIEMPVLSTGAVIAIVCIALAIVILLGVFLTVCLCGKFDQCCRWSRRRAIGRDEIVHEQEVTESRREFNDIRQQHDDVRDQIRAKYNLNTGNSDAAIVA